MIRESKVERRIGVAGGVGLGEYVRHLAMIDYVCFAGTVYFGIVAYLLVTHAKCIHICTLSGRISRGPGL